MRNFLASFFEKITKKLRKTPLISTLEEERRVINREKAIEEITSKVEKTHKKKIPEKKTEIIPYEINPIRDVIDLMEFPFLSLSKDRVNPIIYESEDKTQKVEISGHRGHFIASIYDWDIILVVAGKIQEILNNGSGIPPKKIIIPRHELLKALHKQDGRKQQKDLEKGLEKSLAKVEGEIILEELVEDDSSSTLKIVASLNNI